MLERRKLERFELSLSTSIRVVAPGHESEKEAINLFTKNICEGGAFFDTSHLLPQGTEVKLTLVLPLNRLKM